MQPDNTTDLFLQAADRALRTLFSRPQSAQPRPVHTQPETDRSDGNGLEPIAPLSPEEAKLSAALMRVNHVGEVCAQALYSAQALATPTASLRAHYLQAGAEETDHLAWTAARLEELHARPSILNPLWYAGAFGLGLLAGRLGDGLSLGFVVETEQQVGAHLKSHLERLSPNDTASRAIVQRMFEDETRHAESAQAAGAVTLPAPAKHLMRAAARVMTGLAHYI